MFKTNALIALTLISSFFIAPIVEARSYSTSRSSSFSSSRSSSSSSSYSTSKPSTTTTTTKPSSSYSTSYSTYKATTPAPTSTYTETTRNTMPTSSNTSTSYSTSKPRTTPTSGTTQTTYNTRYYNTTTSASQRPNPNSVMIKTAIGTFAGMAVYDMITDENGNTVKAAPYYMSGSERVTVSGEIAPVQKPTTEPMDSNILGWTFVILSVL